jgi:hypothetical protein
MSEQSEKNAGSGVSGVSHSTQDVMGFEFVVFSMPDGTEFSNDPRFDYAKQHQAMVNSSVPHTGTVSPTNPPARPAEGGAHEASRQAEESLASLGGPDSTTTDEGKKLQGIRPFSEGLNNGDEDEEDDDEPIASEPYENATRDQLLAEMARRREAGRDLPQVSKKAEMVDALRADDEDDEG